MRMAIEISCSLSLQNIIFDYSIGKQIKVTDIHFSFDYLILSHVMFLGQKQDFIKEKFQAIALKLPRVTVTVFLDCFPDNKTVKVGGLEKLFLDAIVIKHNLYEQTEQKTAK